ncbi:CPBP family intramembrane metalloprotease [Pseudoalteromonas sp. JBTF-M23]|uniref:CPBP family intramembrane metalloprotease n=1 Tax=Pseudoalteromonas caenipelagi TaxID=2726988 RepID=A0A849V8Q5_9GAMM|nr:CPBP family intramembrane glutamic endopeptidase [Pseudoalteromonas caenipelagi]NOU49308.1 CPBP family intramembrane metalloprotease [Pseudoalteromonas caenipelagi]
MRYLREFTHSKPIFSYLILCFSFTWLVWFTVPNIAGDNWAFGKIIVGAGFGPAIAAIILAQLHGTGCRFSSKKWWGSFSIVFVIMAVIYTSMLLTGDAITLELFKQTKPLGLSTLSIACVVISSAVSGFIVASLLCSRNSRLNSLLQFSANTKWCLTALLLPAAWMVLGLLTVKLSGAPLPAFPLDLLNSTDSLFVLRSILFTLIVVAIGEEAGWRAWLLPELQKRFSPLVSSFFLGLIWGAWHFPLFVIGQYPDAPTAVFAKMGACVILATLFTWLYNHSKQSLLVAVIFHTALNNSARILPFTEQSGIYMLAIFIAVIIFDKMWAKRG